MSTFTDQFTPLAFPGLGLVRFPEVKVSHEERIALGAPPKCSNANLLRHLAWAGYQALKAKGKFSTISEAQVVAQLKMEFETFEKTGVYDYLLMVWDINRWADANHIMRGWGRGSAASSLVLYLIGITKVNPIRHNLNFPRFISEARMKPVIKGGVVYVDGKAAPDIDCDYEFGRRVEVVRYIEGRYPGRVCKICTRLELTGKMALKDTLKIYQGYTQDDAQKVSDLIESRFGKVQDLHEAREKNKDIKDWLAVSPANRDAYEVAMAIEGLAYAKGMHPSGVFINYDLLDGNIPMELSGKTKEIMASFDMETIAQLGIKVDILGVRTLDLVADTARLAHIPLDDIDVEDPSIYEYLNKTGNYVGLFQIEDGTTKEAVVKVGPKDIDALSVCLAISRPGAFRYLDQYADYSRNGTIKPIHPTIDLALKDTGNVLVYQEQITRICNEVFGLSLVDADQVRYAVGKKKREEMAKWEPVLDANGVSRNVPPEVIKYFWSVCSASADYLFVLAHAVSYAYLTAVCVYLKAHYPTEFYLVMLKLAREEPDPLTYMRTIIKETNLVGIKVLPPDILHSAPDFSIEEDPITPGLRHIRFGLSHIRGISDQTMPKLAKFRGRSFATKFEIFDAARTEEIDIRILVALIYSGCLQWKGTSRTRLALEAQVYNQLTDTQKRRVKQFATEYAEDIIEILRALPTKKTEKGGSLIPARQIDSIRKKAAPYWDMFIKNNGNEQLCAYVQERHYLGFSYSANLRSVYAVKVNGLMTLEEVRQRAAKEKAAASVVLPPGQKAPWPAPVQVAAVVEWIKEGVSLKNGEPYWRGELTDDTGSFMFMVYGQQNCDSIRAYNNRVPEEDDIVLVTGTLSKDKGMIFATSCFVQDNPVQTKKSKEVAVAPA